MSLGRFWGKLSGFQRNELKTIWISFAGVWVCDAPYTDILQVELLILVYTIYKKKYLPHRVMLKIKYENGS